MFATLLGRLPRPPLPAEAPPETAVRAALEAQAAAGLEPLTDGGLWADAADGGDPVARWRSTAALTELAVKAAIVGPWTAARDGRDLEDAVRRARATILELAAAGCPLVEVHEPAAVELGDDATAARRFAAAHRALLAGVTGIHASLAILGGNADRAGIGTFVAAPYASLALDVIRGPDNWRLAAAAPGGRGIVVGALTAARDGDRSVEVLLWSLGYAASTGGRGPDRVGIAPAGDLDGLSWDEAVARMQLVGRAVRLWLASPDERAAAVDPRAVSARAAALGRSGIRRRAPDRPKRGS